MGSAHQLWVLRNVSLELLGCYCVSKRVDFDHLMWISQKQWAKATDQPRDTQGILGWDWRGTLKGYGLIAWCDEPYVILYHYDVFLCHHWQVLLSTTQSASLRGCEFMILISASLRALVYSICIDISTPFLWTHGSFSLFAHHAPTISHVLVFPRCGYLLEPARLEASLCSCCVHCCFSRVVSPPGVPSARPPAAVHSLGLRQH